MQGIHQGDIIIGAESHAEKQSVVAIRRQRIKKPSSALQLARVSFLLDLMNLEIVGNF